MGGLGLALGLGLRDGLGLARGLGLLEGLEGVEPARCKNPVQNSTCVQMSYSRGGNGPHANCISSHPAWQVINAAKISKSWHYLAGSCMCAAVCRSSMHLGGYHGCSCACCSSRQQCLALTWQAGVGTRHVMWPVAVEDLVVEEQAGAAGHVVGLGLSHTPVVTLQGSTSYA